MDGSIQELLKAATDACEISDDFEILGEGTPMERVEGSVLWRVTGVPQPELDWLPLEKEKNKRLSAELEQKQNTIAMLARKLRSLGYEP